MCAKPVQKPFVISSPLYENRPRLCGSNSFHSYSYIPCSIYPFLHVDGAMWPSPCSAGKPSPELSYRFPQPFPDLASFSALNPHTDILLLICASFIISSYHKFFLDPVPCDVKVCTFCSDSLLQLRFPFFLAGVTPSGDAFAT